MELNLISETPVGDTWSLQWIDANPESPINPWLRKRLRTRVSNADPVNTQLALEGTIVPSSQGPQRPELEQKTTRSKDVVAAEEAVQGMLEKRMKVTGRIEKEDKKVVNE